MTNERNERIGASGRVPSIEVDADRDPRNPGDPRASRAVGTGEHGERGEATTVRDGVDSAEHMFDAGGTTRAPQAEATERAQGDDDVDQDDEDGWVQKQSLTLLRGGVGQTDDASGAPVSPHAHPASRPAPQPLRAIPTTGTGIINPRFLDPAALTGLTHDEPLTRYRPEAHRPPLWSTQATWRDLVQITPVPVHRPATRAWPHTWTLTTKHGNTIDTTSVATANPVDLFAADPVRTAHWHPRATARAGLRYAASSHALYFHESLAERDTIVAFDYDGIVDLVSQPFTLTWDDGDRDRTHTPDFLIATADATLVVNVRPLHLVRPQLLANCAAMQAVCLSRGWEHVLVTGMTRPAFANVQTLVPAGTPYDRWGLGDSLLATLATHGPQTIEALEAVSPAPVVTRALVLRLIWERRLDVNLNELFDPTTTVHLPGQTRLRDGGRA